MNRFVVSTLTLWALGASVPGASAISGIEPFGPEFDPFFNDVHHVSHHRRHADMPEATAASKTNEIFTMPPFDFGSPFGELSSPSNNRQGRQMEDFDSGFGRQFSDFGGFDEVGEFPSPPNFGAPAEDEEQGFYRPPQPLRQERPQPQQRQQQPAYGRETVRARAPPQVNRRQLQAEVPQQQQQQSQQGRPYERYESQRVQGGQELKPQQPQKVYKEKKPVQIKKKNPFSTKKYAAVPQKPQERPQQYEPQQYEPQQYEPQQYEPQQYEPKPPQAREASFSDPAPAVAKAREQRPVYSKPESRVDSSPYTDIPVAAPKFDTYKPASGPAYASGGDFGGVAEPRFDALRVPEGVEAQQRDIQGAVFAGANAYKPDGVYQTEDRLEFQIHGQQGPHSYRYGYDTGNGYNRQFRYEERDKDGYVKGRYGFYDKYGELKVVNYEADPYKGFKAEGAHVPHYPH